MRIKGELLTTYAFQVEKGSNIITLPNYYDNETPIQISLDTTKSATQNAQSYFKKYQKEEQRQREERERLIMLGSIVGILLMLVIVIISRKKRYGGK